MRPAEWWSNVCIYTFVLNLRCTRFAILLDLILRMNEGCRGYFFKPLIVPIAFFYACIPISMEPLWSIYAQYILLSYLARDTVWTYNIEIKNCPMSISI